MTWNLENMDPTTKKMKGALVVNDVDLSKVDHKENERSTSGK